MNNKIFKKFSIFMSFLFIFMTASISVFAATPSIAKNSPTEGTITITKKGAEFTGYQLLSATQSGDAYEYAPTSEFTNFFNNQKYTMDSKTTYTIKNLQKLTPDQVKDLAVNIHKYVLENNIKGTNLLQGQKTKVSLGYYLVTETSGNSEGPNVASTPILVSVPQVLNNAWNYNVTINPKDNKPALEKNIIVDGKKVKTSSANIGDVIKYEVNSVIPSYASNATGIKYTFTDTMSKGLTYDKNAGFKITSGDKIFVENTDYTVKTSTDSNKNTVITIDFKYDSIKNYATKGLTLDYQATLNSNAVVSTQNNNGNPNDVDLEYTNNPFVKDSYKHLKDHVTTYTWGFGVHKVDANDITKDLAGAEFSVKDSNNKVVGKYTYNKDGQVILLPGTNGTTDSKGNVTFTGLKEGNYFITEEKAPAGYSILKKPVEVTITPKIENGDYTGAASISVTNGNEAASTSDNITMKDGNVLFNVTIKDYAGFSLPGTGGLGTNGFVKIGLTLLGVVVVLGAGYVLLDKRKRA